MATFVFIPRYLSTLTGSWIFTKVFLNGLNVDIISTGTISTFAFKAIKLTPSFILALSIFLVLVPSGIMPRVFPSLSNFIEYLRLAKSLPSLSTGITPSFFTIQPTIGQVVISFFATKCIWFGIEIAKNIGSQLDLWLAHRI